ncbi:MAG: hypothetical protein K0U49_04030, partial [Alphaproteobacteria bacterium]|nr:hypothetical protein [Alphaproteobacteria bacterium]
MQILQKTLSLLIFSILVLPAVQFQKVSAQTLQESNAVMFREMQAARGMSKSEMTKIQNIFAGSSFIGQGNPAI